MKNISRKLYPYTYYFSYKCDKRKAKAKTSGLHVNIFSLYLTSGDSEYWNLLSLFFFDYIFSFSFLLYAYSGYSLNIPGLGI